MDDDEGWMYALTNESFEKDIVKIGITTDNPEVRAEKLYGTGVPTPFQIAVAKRVKNPKKKELTMHRLLTKLGVRVNNKREFFRLSDEKLKLIFHLLDGEEYVPSIKNNKIDSYEKFKEDLMVCFENNAFIQEFGNEQCNLEDFIKAYSKWARDNKGKFAGKKLTNAGLRNKLEEDLGKQEEKTVFKRCFVFFDSDSKKEFIQERMKLPNSTPPLGKN